MTYVVVIAGLVLLVFLHELGHFTVARAVGMRPRSFYIGFPPALVKVKRKGIEYGIGMIPLGGLVQLPGMNRPAGGDVYGIYGQPALREEPSLAPFVQRGQACPRRRGLRRGAASHLPELQQHVEAAELSRAARRSANRALRDVDEGTGTDAYWRQATWKRVAVIAAGPLANVLVAFLILFLVFAISGGPRTRSHGRGCRRQRAYTGGRGRPAARRPRRRRERQARGDVRLGLAPHPGRATAAR